MIQEAVERAKSYADCYGVQIYTDYLTEVMLYKIYFRCGELMSDITISDFELTQLEQPEMCLDHIMKDGIDLIYQAWRTVR